jgi:hypothetical protein
MLKKGGAILQVMDLIISGFEGGYEKVAVSN